MPGGSGPTQGQPQPQARRSLAGAVSEGITPVEFMLSIMRDENEDEKKRAWAAEKAAPYIHPRPAPLARAIEIDLPDTGTIEGIRRRSCCDHAGGFNRADFAIGSTEPCRPDRNATQGHRDRRIGRTHRGAGAGPGDETESMMARLTDRLSALESRTAPGRARISKITDEQLQAIVETGPTSEAIRWHSST